MSGERAQTAPIVAGWKLLPDYAEPATAGGGYVEVQPNGDFEIAYEADQSARDMGLGPFLLTFVPVEVIRALLASYDAAHGTATRSLVEGEIAHMREGCRILRAIPSDIGIEVGEADYVAYHAWLDAEAAGDQVTP